VTWATSVPILVFIGLSVLDLVPMYATDVRLRRASSLNAPCPRGGGIMTTSDECPWRIMLWVETSRLLKLLLQVSVTNIPHISSPQSKLSIRMRSITFLWISVLFISAGLREAKTAGIKFTHMLNIRVFPRRGDSLNRFK